MAALSSSSLFFSSKTTFPISNLLIPPSLHRFSLPSSSSSFSSLSSSSSSSASPLTYSLTSFRRLSPHGFTVKASGEKKNVLIVNTNSGGHAVIGFYFAKELLSAGHAVTIMTVGDESSDKMKKPPFSRFSVSFFRFANFHIFSETGCRQEIVSGGGKTVWGNPADVANVVGGETFDVVLDNNGKDLDTVRYASLITKPCLKKKKRISMD